MPKQHAQITKDHILVPVTLVGLEMDLIALVSNASFCRNLHNLSFLKQITIPDCGHRQIDIIDFTFSKKLIHL